MLVKTLCLTSFTHPLDLEEFNKQATCYQRENFFFSQRLNLGQHFEYALKNKKVEENSYYLNVVIRRHPNLTDCQAAINIFHPVPTSQSNLQATIFGPVQSFNDLPLTLVNIGGKNEQSKLRNFVFYLNEEVLNPKNIENYNTYKDCIIVSLDDSYSTKSTYINMFILWDEQKKEIYNARFTKLNDATYRLFSLVKYLHESRPTFAINTYATNNFGQTVPSLLVYIDNNSALVNPFTFVPNHISTTLTPLPNNVTNIAFDRQDKILRIMGNDNKYQDYSEENGSIEPTILIEPKQKLVETLTRSIGAFLIDLPLLLKPTTPNIQQNNINNNSTQNKQNKPIINSTPFWKRPIFIGTALSFSLFSFLCYLVYKANFFSSFSNKLVYEQ